MKMMYKLYIIFAMMLTMLACTLPAASRSSEKIPTVLLPLKDSPLITFRIQFLSGSVNDPAGKKGLTALTASLIANGGTKEKAYDEIVALFYPMATRVRAQTDNEVTTFVGTVHVDNLEEFYALLREMLLEPGFNAADFERVKSNQLNYLAKQLRGNDDEELSKEALNSFIYKGNPYGYPVQGLIQDLRSITLQDVKEHYKRIFTRDNVILGVAGGYTDQLVQKVLKDLEKLPPGKPEGVEVDKVEPIENIEVLAVEKECKSTAVAIGYPIAVTRGDEDFYPLMIANSYFGEHRTFNGILMIHMREQRGLNYGDYSYIENFIQAGGSTFPLTNIPRHRQYFSIWIRPVLHKNRHFAIREAIRELERLVTEGISKEDFDLTRQFLKNYSKLWAQDQSRRLGYLMDSRFYGTEDFIKTLPTELDRVTLAEVNTAIKKYLNYKNIKMAVVTKGAAQFLQHLIDNTASPINYQAKKMPGEILQEDREIEVYHLNINMNKSIVVNADELFEK